MESNVPSLETNVTPIVQASIPPIVETNVPQYTKVDEWTPLVIAKLRGIFGEKTDRLFALLRETGGLIAGGQILSACQPFDQADETNRIQDTDIYVPVKHIPTFLNTFIEGDDPIYHPNTFISYGASLYCKSFLRKNGIRRVFKFAIKEEQEQTQQYLSYPRIVSEVDIMSVRNRRTPLAVVNNFDLTFCQVWFDGKDVYASDPDHIREKSGFIRYDYCKTLVNGNYFLKKRIAKYVSRGFKIKFDPKFSDIILGEYFLNNLCSIKGKYSCKITDLSETQRWYYRIALRWLSNDRDSVDNKNLVIPLREHNNERFTQLYADPNNNIYTYNNIRDFKIKISDGYDTEDIEITDDIQSNNFFRRMAITHYIPENADEIRPSDDLIFYRSMTKLAMNSLVETPNRYSFANIMKVYKNTRAGLIAKHYINIVIGRSLRDGSDIFGNDGRLYDIHEHDLDGGITRESLETYLSNTLSGTSYDVRCYYSAAGCNKILEKEEIKTLVSPEFYQVYSAPRIVKTGLNTDVDNYEIVFRNTKTLDPVYGNIYHATMCPYCLKFDERGDGCSVMTHENPERLPHEEAPFCPDKKSVDSIRQKYLDAAVRLSDGYYHLEFCVECGRPCSGHQHFNLDLSGMVQVNLLQGENGRLTADYGTCTGGGRVEMIARMLAVRDIYNRKDIHDSVEERRIAAEAADAAPLNPELMARAQAIWDKAPADRKWNVEVPKKKRYSNIESKNDGNNHGNNDGNNSINNNYDYNSNINDENSNINGPVELNHHGGAKNIVTLNQLRKLRNLNRQTRRTRR